MKITLAGLLCLATQSIIAQYNTLSEWYVGVNGGATMSSITMIPKYVDMMYKTGRTAGFTVRYVSEKHFGFQLECNYEELGWLEDYNETNNASDYSYSRQLNFIEVPFLMHAYAATKAVHFFINAGPDFHYLLSESEDNRNTTLTYAQYGKLVEKPFQYGVLGGGGLEVHIGRAILGLEGRYCYDLSNLFDDEIGSDINTSDLQSISLKMYLVFQLTGLNKQKH